MQLQANQTSHRWSHNSLTGPALRAGGRAKRRLLPVQNMNMLSQKRVGIQRALYLVSLLLFELLSFPVSAATVVAWGNNSFGQTNIPAGLTDAIAIAAGAQQSLALRPNGTILGWGSSSMGLKTPPAGLTNVIAIAIGASNSMALKADNSVVVWGQNMFGPVFVPAGLTNIVAIGGGFVDSLVLRPDGALLSWGRQPSLVAVQSNVVATSQSISAGVTHSLALGPDGEVLAWGDNSLGQCEVPADLTNVEAVAAGSGFSLPSRATGRWLAGANTGITRRWALSQSRSPPKRPTWWPWPLAVASEWPSRLTAQSCVGAPTGTARNICQ